MKTEKETESQSGQTEIQLAAYVEATVSAVDVGTFCHLAHHFKYVPLWGWTMAFSGRVKPNSFALPVWQKVCGV
ncbi:MAG: hypothetical protein ACLR7N_12315 [Roseburia hominis]